MERPCHLKYTAVMAIGRDRVILSPVIAIGRDRVIISPVMSPGDVGWIPVNLVAVVLAL